MTFLNIKEFSSKLKKQIDVFLNFDYQTIYIKPALICMQEYLNLRNFIF